MRLYKSEPPCKYSVNACPFLIILVLTLVAFLLVPGHLTAAAPLRQEARVIAVNDGDTVTIRMDNKVYRTRLIGIDAPEMGQEPWGEKAREHLRMLLEKSDGRVFIETDVVQFDKYDRLLVYIWSDNETLLNEQMLLHGYSVLFTIQPNIKYVDQFRNAQRLAREKKLGIWASDGLKERPLEYKKKHPRE